MMKMPPPLECIKQLIATPSISSTKPELDQSNADVVHLLAQWFEALGFQITVQPVNVGKVNLIATLGSGPGGLVLSGHTDTVPFDAQRWSTDPFVAQQQGNRLYGLGTSDMKSFFALVLAAAKIFTAKELRQPLIVLATADEETTMAGALALQTAWPHTPQHAIIGEPTNLRPVRMHKGIMMEKIHILGRAGHSSDPSLGHNAIEAMATVLAALTQWREELRRQHHNDCFAVPYPTLNFGHIHGGDNPNRICGECELHIDLRPLPGMSLTDLRAELHARLQRATADTPFSVTCEALFSGIPALETAANAHIIQSAEALTGQTATAVAFGTEAPYLTQLGMDTVILGPGGIELAHQPNEYLVLDQITPTVQLLQQMIQRYCL